MSLDVHKNLSLSSNYCTTLLSDVLGLAESEISTELGRKSGALPRLDYEGAREELDPGIMESLHR